MSCLLVCADALVHLLITATINYLECFFNSFLKMPVAFSLIAKRYLQATFLSFLVLRSSNCIKFSKFRLHKQWTKKPNPSVHGPVGGGKTVGLFLSMFVSSFAIGRANKIPFLFYMWTILSPRSVDWIEPISTFWRFAMIHSITTTCVLTSFLVMSVSHVIGLVEHRAKTKTVL